MLGKHLYSPLLLACLLCPLLLTSTVRANETITVAIDKTYSPLSLVTPDGKPAGILVEMWQLWSEQTGVKVEFAPGTWAETMDMLKSGGAEVHSGLFKTDERSQWLDFSDAIYSIVSALYYRTKSEYSGFESLKGKRIGAVSGTYQYGFLQDNHPEVTIVSYQDHEQLIMALMLGDVDAVYDEVPPIQKSISRYGWQGLISRSSESERPNTVHSAVRKGRTDLIKKIDEGFRRLNPASLAVIDNRWIPVAEDRYYQDTTQKLKVSLTEEEKAFLSRHRSVSLTSTPNWPPFEMKMEDGSYSGIAADFMRLAASKVGLDIQPVFDTNWSAHMDKLRNGVLDVAPGLNKTPSRLEHFTFTKPYIEYYSAIFTRTDRTDINAPTDLEGKIVALEDGYAIARNLPKDRPDIRIKLVGTTQEALEAVAAGKADAYIGNQVVASYLIKKFTLPNLKLVSLWRTDLPGQLRFAVNKNTPVLRDVLQKGLDAISTVERNTILSTYLDASGFKQKIFSLTQDQWEWLKAHPKITLGVDPTGAPFEFIDDKGNYGGISSEYVSIIKNKLKIDLTPVNGLDWNGVLQYAEQGRLDVVTAVAHTPAREQFLLFTDPYLEFPIVVYSIAEAPLISSISDIAGNRVATIEGFAINDYLAADYPEIKPVTYPNVEEALTALTLGEVDWFINDLATGSYTIQKQGIANLKVAASTDYKVALAMGVRKDMPELVDILNRVLASIPEDKTAEIKNSWLTLKFEHGLDMKTVLSWVLPITGGVLFIIGLIIVWNRKLGSEIAERKAAEQALSVSEVKYRGLVENANSVILKLDVQGQIIFFNEFAQTFFGYTAEEIEGQPIVGTIIARESEDEKLNLAAYIQDLIKHPERHQTNENENVRKNGETVWINWNNQAIFDERGNFVELLCVGVDVTERRKAQAELADTISVLDEKNKMLEGLSSKLAKYLSPQVYDSIFSGSRDVALSTERKKLTVFFSDIKDFTKTTDDMQPEDLTDLLNRYFTEMSAIALEYGATIDKFIGDAMLMFFGDPETKGVQEDARLCVRMAVAMQKRMVELESEWQRLGFNKPFKMRVGVNTGYCNVGNFGSETRMDYTIIGGEVNLAARLEGQADPGGILLSSETHSLVQDIVRTEERDPISVKGIRRSIRPYAVISLHDADTHGTQPGQVIQYRTEGIDVSVDPDRLTPEKRKEISTRLNEIAEWLKE